jgi:hypothetical protein
MSRFQTIACATQAFRKGRCSQNLVSLVR